MTSDHAGDCPVERRPALDPEAEDARVAAYWKWLDARLPSDRRRRSELRLPDARNWVRIETAADADFEAFHMRHSIGHSWAKYSSLGEIHGLRSFEGRPQATVLVVDGVVVHAREERNARLCGKNERALAFLAGRRGWTTTPDQLPFDAFLDGPGDNTILRYILRAPDNSKEFKEAVLRGRPDEATTTALLALAAGGREVPPRDLGIGDDAEDPHEILLLAPTAAPATLDLGIGVAAERWQAAATGRSASPW